MDFQLIRTNIAMLDADAVVLPANTHLHEGSGTSRVLFEAAGRKELTQACRQIGTCEVGCAVPTLAFDLDAKFIIHTVVPKWEDGLHGEYDLLSAAYLSALKIADVMQCESIAFPLLASGNNGFDLDLAFQIAVESIHSFQGDSLKQVTLVIYGQRVTDLVKSKGYPVIEISEHYYDRPAAKSEFQKHAKSFVHDVAVDQLHNAREYLKDPENVKKIIIAGAQIAKIVFA